MNILQLDPIKYITIKEFLNNFMPWDYDKEPNGIRNCYTCALKIKFKNDKWMRYPVTLGDLTFYRLNFCSGGCARKTKF